MSLLEIGAWALVFFMGVWAGSKYETSRVHQASEKKTPFSANGNQYSITKIT